MEHYLYKRQAEEIIYHLQSKLQMQLSDDLRHDIYSNVLKAVLVENELAISGRDHWKQEHDELKAKGFPVNWNELRITLAQHIDKPITARMVLDWMFKRDQGERTR